MSFTKENYCLESDSMKNGDGFESFLLCKTSGNKSSRLFTLICCYLALIDIVQGASDSRCDPFDYRSCRFGGECTSVSTYFLGIDFRPSEYRCRCRDINILDFEFAPVCGSVGGELKTFYNDVQRRYTECASQRSIEVVCNGLCELSEQCQAVTNSERRCPAEEGSYCFNFGECLLSESGAQYCNCLDGYTGPRCGLVVPRDRIILERISAKYLLQPLINRQ